MGIQLLPRVPGRRQKPECGGPGAGRWDPVRQVKPAERLVGKVCSPLRLQLS